MNANMKSPTGSDFQFWQHRRIMDEACKTVTRVGESLLGRLFACKTDGSGALTELSAIRIEREIQRALDITIGSQARRKGPTVVDGTIGHVSDQKYVVDRQFNSLSTNKIVGTFTMVPNTYAKEISTTLSFGLTIPTVG